MLYLFTVCICIHANVDLCRLDVYGENARDVVMFESEKFGSVAVVCIGAMMVGSICLTANEGTYLHRADELGYFAFGGSTIVVLWQKDTLTFDQDLVDNSEKTIETLVMLSFLFLIPS